jgi:rhamnulokinase
MSGNTESDGLHVAIDLGASGGRVALGWLSQGKLEVEILHRFPNGAVPIRACLHWDIVGLWREVLHGLRLAAARGREMMKPVASIGVDSWAVDFALLDGRDEILSGVRSYRDRRTDGVMNQVLETNSLAELPRAEIYGATGLQFLPFNTLYQLLAIQRDNPEQLERARSLLLIPDLLHFWLTGRKVCERTNASTTQFYNPSSRGWARDLLERVGLPHHFLPEIVDAGSVIGALEPALAADLGLLGTVVVAVGTHDTASAVAAAPLTTPQSAYISSGTWSLVGLETGGAVLNIAALEANLTNEAGVHSTNRLLKNVMGLWILQECRRAWGFADGSDPEWTDLYQEARESATSARIDPDDARYLAPGLDMPMRIAAHCDELGQKTPQSRGETVRLILESLASRYGVVLRELEAASGVQVDVLHIIGGGSQIALLNELTSSATGLPVIAGPVDATLIGNLLVQLGALGEIQAATGRELVRASFSLERYTPQGGTHHG